MIGRFISPCAFDDEEGFPFSPASFVSGEHFERVKEVGSNDILNALQEVLSLFRAERKTAGRFEYTRLMAMAAAEAERLLALVLYAQSKE